MGKRIILCTALCLVLLAGAVLLYHLPSSGAGIPCPIYTVTGFYCPGCGASRALRSLLHLQFYQAFRYSPALIVLLPFIAAYLVARMVDYIRTGKNHIDAKLNFKLLWWILVLLFVYGVLRNLPWLPFSLLAPTALS